MAKNKIQLVDRSWMERARIKRGITQYAVAEYAGCNVSFYNRIEKGTQLPNVYLALKICECLNEDVHQFGSEVKLV